MTTTLVNTEVHQLQRVVCVMAGMRAGSGLMTSLLDNHPNLLNTPDDILMGFYEFWGEYGHLPANELVSEFLDYYAVLFDAWGTCKCPRVASEIGDLLNWTALGPEHNEKLNVDQEVFRQAMAKIVGTDNKVRRKLFFQAIHVAYAEALGRRVEDPQIVFSLHIAHRHLLQKFFDDFEDGKFLQMVRHPISGLASLFRHYYENGYVSSTTGVEMIAISIGGPVISKEHRSQWRGVRLEDIHENPRETMQRVCDWLQIPWDETLLESTVNDQKWWNDKDRPQVSGPNDVILSRPNDDLIPAFDRFRLSVLSAKRCRAAGYEVKRWHKWKLTRFFVLPLILIPLKVEFISFSRVPWGGFDRGWLAVDPRTEPFISRIPGILHAIYLGRRVMLGAWLRLFTKDNNPMELV